MPAQNVTKPIVIQGVGLIALLAMSLQAAAQGPGVVSEKDFLTEMPMVLSVSRLPQRLDETPGAVTLLDRDMIRLSGARDVADLLRLVPGFQTSTSFETTAPLASYHGSFDSYSNRIQVLVDGRSVYSPYFIGSVGAGLQTVALADIERVEVLRGSNSAAYGARAMLGVINIVTRHTVDTLGLQATLTAGENGVRDSQARMGWGVEDASFRLSVDRRGDDGLAGANGHNQVNRANQVSRVNFRADLRANARDEVQLRAGGLDIDAGKGYPGQVSDPLRDIFLDSGYAQLDWRRSLGEDEDLAFSLSHTHETYRDRFPYSLGRLGSIDIDGSGRSRNDSVSLQHTVRQSSVLRVVWGGEFRREQVTARQVYNTDAALVTEFTRLFGNAEWRLAQDLILNAGAMAEKSSVNGSGVAPRLMLNWHVAPGQTLRAGVSRAHRPPSTFEQFANVRYALNGVALRTDVLTRGAIQPERVVVHELGYLGDFPTWRASLDVRAFHERMTGFVRRQQYALPAATTLFPSNPYEYVNAEDFSIHGLEYQLKWRPWRDAQMIFSQAYTSITSVDAGTARAVPKLASSITFFQKLPGGLDLSLMHQDSGQDSGMDGQAPITRTDLRLGLPLRFGANRGELALVVQNLGAPYHDFSPNFEFQRRAFVSLRIEN